ncbi:MAG: hypothetical protein ABI769_18085 [Pseudomonadota bacterium]
MGIDTGTYRVRHAPLPPSLNVSAKSHARWLHAFDTAQRFGALSFDGAMKKASTFEPEFRAMVEYRLRALRYLPTELPARR